jgi:hypothetical protein
VSRQQFQLGNGLVFNALPREQRGHFVQGDFIESEIEMKKVTRNNPEPLACAAAAGLAALSPTRWRGAPACLSAFSTQPRNGKLEELLQRVSGQRFHIIKFRGACRRASKQVRQTRMNHTFRDTQFMSARERQLVLAAWVRFLRRGLRFVDFTNRLYQHLILHCSFIAHYDRAGFYRTYFERGEDTLRFLSQFDGRGESGSVEYGGGWWLRGDYADVNRAMIEEGGTYIPALMEQAQARQREADLAHARALLAKHGLRLD